MNDPDARRARLAYAQAGLLAHLMDDGPAPLGIGVTELRAVRDALADKRAAQVAAAWPGTARGLGTSFLDFFDVFARQVSAPRHADAVVDGRRFVSYLARVGALSDAGRAQALAFDLRYRIDHDGVCARRGVGCRVARLRRPPTAVIGIRLTAGRTPLVFVPLGRRRRNR